MVRRSILMAKLERALTILPVLLVIGTAVLDWRVAAGLTLGFLGALAIYQLIHAIEWGETASGLTMDADSYRQIKQR
jgi:hypothetical protein